MVQARNAEEAEARVAALAIDLASAMNQFNYSGRRLQYYDSIYHEPTQFKLSFLVIYITN